MHFPSELAAALIFGRELFRRAKSLVVSYEILTIEFAAFISRAFKISFNQLLHDIQGVSLVTLQSIQAQDHLEEQSSF
jgi:hypothetical protein